MVRKRHTRPPIISRRSPLSKKQSGSLSFITTLVFGVLASIFSFSLFTNTVTIIVISVLGAVAGYLIGRRMSANTSIKK